MLKPNILYITSYYLDDVIDQRKSTPYISQAGQNKSEFMIKCLSVFANVNVWSNAWTSCKLMRYYKGFQSSVDPKIYYSDIIGWPVLNSLSCLISGMKYINRVIKESKINAIVFYNYRVETALLAKYAKRKYKIPIYIEFEDDFLNDCSIGRMKKRVFAKVEEWVMPCLDGAILVTSNLHQRVHCDSMIIRGAISKSGCKNVYSGPGGKIRILFASSLDEKRGGKIVLDALNYIDENFELIVTGRGELEEAFETTSDERVQYLGYLSYEMYLKELAKADICLCAQLMNDDFCAGCFPSKIFEFLSARKVVVSSAVSDVREVLGDTIIVYEQDDGEKLALALKKAIEICQNCEALQHYQEEVDKFVNDNAIEAVAERLQELLF